MDYVICVQAPAYPLSAASFATESAFSEHLKELRRSVGPRFARVVLIAPRLTEQEYAAQKPHLGIVNSETDEVQFLPAHPTSATPWQFWRSHAWRVWRMARTATASAGVVHSGMSTDIWRPLMAMVNLAAWSAGCPVVFIVDIDFRQHSRRFYRIGAWSLRSYVVNRLFYDPLKWLQVWLAPRMFELVLLKSASMVEDFGRGRANVKNFYDTVHSAQDVLPEEDSPARLEWLRDSRKPLQAIFFGRFVPYKGLDRAVDALRLARADGEDIRLTLVGAGECQEALRQQVAHCGLDAVVAFCPPVRYGPELFARLGEAHVALATPLIEDTPRAAFDAMARGLPIIAFDIGYFKDLARSSGAVLLAAWPSPRGIADRLIEMSRNRELLATMAARGLDFARANTQTEWLQRRSEWVLQVVREPATLQLRASAR